MSSQDIDPAGKCFECHTVLFTRQVTTGDRAAIYAVHYQIRCMNPACAAYLSGRWTGVTYEWYLKALKAGLLDTILISSSELQSPKLSGLDQDSKDSADVSSQRFRIDPELD